MKKPDNFHRSGRADKTREKILRSAIKEFSARGLSGARMDAIAKTSRVNKALLYYYFKSKEALYTAALKEVSGRVSETALAAITHPSSPGERLLRLALDHFDRILTQRDFQNLMQQEMVRFRLGESSALPILVKSAFQPIHEKVEGAVLEGITTGELCDMDPLQVMYSMFGANVFYFLSAPIMRLIVPFDPFSVDAVKHRREALLKFLGQALFQDRRHGAELAKQVLANVPVPEIKPFSARRKRL
ncbi:MAG TPA: TetR/AcrR family transcriptional regulator [Pseudacidobacterium sp.]|nr:TetR/AcrR family transcriptional regulator [Pseudacidobacterium sp.]